MKSICMLTGNLILREKKTGVHLHHETIVKELLKRNLNYELKIATFDPEGKCCQLVENKEQWIKSNVIFTKLHRIFGFIFPIEMIFGRHDVYFCDGLFPHIWDKKAKRVCFVHDLMVKVYPEYYSCVMRIYLELFFSRLSKADLIICSSENTKKDIIKFYGVKEDKIIVSYSSWKIAENIDDNIPDNELIKPMSDFIFYIGDMRPNKNLVNTLKGYVHYCKKNKNSDLKFYFAGNKNGDYEKLVKIVKNEGLGDRVIFLGYISEKDKQILYRNAQAVMLISEYEGFGIPIMEGLYYGTRVITSNCSSTKEVGEGVSILVDPYNIDEISEAIDLACTKEFKVNVNDVKSVLSRYSVENITEVINKAFERITNE